MVSKLSLKADILTERIGKKECMRQSVADKRLRNRSLCNLLCTPPPYPGYSAVMSSIRKEQLFEQQNQRPKFYISTDCDRPSMIDGYSVSIEDSNEWDLSRKINTISKNSSGYGSASSESDNDNEQLKKERKRRNILSYLRKISSEQIVLSLNNEETLDLEKDPDIKTPIYENISPPESVLQLARKFAETIAAQENRRFASNQRKTKDVGKSLSGPTTPVHRPTVRNGEKVKKPGSIASLSLCPMSKMNVYKNYEKIGGTNQSTTTTTKAYNPNSIKEALLRWCQCKLQNYPVTISNFSSSWADGMAFCALIHRFAPDAFDFNRLNPSNRRGNFELAFKVAEEHGVVPLLEVEDMLMMGDRPDWKCVFTYVQTFYKEFKDRP